MAAQVQAVGLVGDAEEQCLAPGDLLVARAQPQRAVVVVEVEGGQVDQRAVGGVGQRAASGAAEGLAEAAAGVDVAHAGAGAADGARAVGVFDGAGLVDDAAQLDGGLE
ncbi:hypothetical protein X551_04644 [Methylibium sp. T29]|nr:hypothetical protein X551_04644 [Methylibium sp. T29]